MKDSILTARENKTPRWYVLSVPQLNSGRAERLAQTMSDRGRLMDRNRPAMDYFVPSLVEKHLVDGQLVNVARPLCSYVFIKGTYEQLKIFHNDYPVYNLVRDKSRDSGYIFVGDQEMLLFRYAVKTQNGEVPYVTDYARLLEKGDKVRICKEGPFENAEGVLVTKQGKDGGSIVIRLCSNFAIELIDIESKYIQFLSFGENNKHVYQKLDSYHPRLFKAIRAYLEKGSLSDEDGRAEVELFFGRYCKLGIEADKTWGRFLVYMLMSCVMLSRSGNDDDAANVAHYILELQKVLSTITNPATKTIALCALCTATKNVKYLNEAKEISSQWSDDEKAKGKKRDAANYVELCGKYVKSVELRAEKDNADHCMLVIPDKTYTADITLEDILSYFPKPYLQSICRRTSLFVNERIRTDETARRLAIEILTHPEEVLSSLNMDDLLLAKELLSSSYVERTPSDKFYKLQTLGLVVTYENANHDRWYILMPSSLRKAIAAYVPLYIMCAEKGLSYPSTRNKRIAELMNLLIIIANKNEKNNNIRN